MSVIDSSEKSSAISTKRLAVFTIITVGIIYGLVCLLSGQNFISMSSASAGILPSNLKTQTSDALRNALKAIPALPNLEKRMNILVMGVDWNGDEAERFAGTRSDTMMLVSLDPVRKKVGIVSIPRDSRVEIARGHGFNKINSAHALGGPILACQTVADNFSVNVDHYLVVDTAGLTKIFELLGPFEVVVEKEMLYKDETAHLDIDLKPGRQLLDPRQTVGYLRFRHDATADIGRIERQQWFLRQALAKTQDPMILLKAPQIIQAGLECISTDMRSEDIASLLSFARDLKSKDIITATLPGQGETIDGINYFVLSANGSQAIISKLFSDAKLNTGKRSSHDSTITDMEKMRRRLRIAIKCSEPMQDYAEELADSLKDKGWRVRYTIKAEHEDCQHAQLNLNSTRITRAMLASLEQDLPAIKDWLVVIKYGASQGSDVVLVLPDRGGLSRWHQKDDLSAQREIPCSNSLAEGASNLIL